jgi:hypothetical protein
MKHAWRARSFCLVAVALTFACGDPTMPSSEPTVRMAKASATGVTVKSTFPSSAPQNITLDVAITGT